MKSTYRIIFAAICLIVFNLNAYIAEAQTFKYSQNELNSNKHSDGIDTGLVLSEYFGELKGDKSTYKLVETNGEATYIEVLSIWKDYRIFIIIIVMATTLLITIYKRLTVINPIHSEKMNLYFTQTPKGVEIEPLTFLLFQASAKKISLAELLETSGYTIEELDASHIYFEPGFNREIVFRHETKNTVRIGTSIAYQKLKYSVVYGTKIHITSEDESYELEIYFISSRY